MVLYIYIAWGRRLDELVDGVNGSHATHDTLDRWKQRTVDTYQGRPWDIYDVALFDTVSNFPIDIQVPLHNILINSLIALSLSML